MLGLWLNAIWQNSRHNCSKPTFDVLFATIDGDIAEKS